MAGLFASTRALSKMTDDKEELKAAESAKAALSIAPLSEPATKTLRNTKDAAIRAMSVFPKEALLNDARHTVGITLYDLIQTVKDGPPTQVKIDKAKDAVEEWINQLGKA